MFAGDGPGRFVSYRSGSSADPHKPGKNHAWPSPADSETGLPQCTRKRCQVGPLHQGRLLTAVRCAQGQARPLRNHFGHLHFLRAPGGARLGAMGQDTVIMKNHWETGQNIASRKRLVHLPIRPSSAIGPGPEVSLPDALRTNCFS